MKETTLTVNGQEYLLGPGGAFLDLDGNLCGFVGSDVTQERDAPHFVDQMVAAIAAKSQQAGAKGGAATAGMAFTAPGLVAMGVVAMGGAMIGNAAYEAWEASNEADQAEQRAREMQARLQAARARRRT